MIKLAELLYRGINRLRRALYRAGMLRAKRLPRPVISIGNIAAGGTGKTPAVITVCRYLESHGLRVAVLTRGYGRAGESSPGDEPALIKQSTNADVIVGKNRYENAVEYLRENDCDVFVLDDGFQHLQLGRDVDIVIDSPSWFHREGRWALADADFVIPRRLRTILPDELRGKRVFAFSGLADNEQFFASLRNAGLEIAGTKSFRDHHRYTAADLEAIRRDAGGASIVTTGKDAVKIDDPSIFIAGAEFDISEEILQSIETAVREQRPKRRRKSLLVQRVEYAVYRFATKRVSRMSDEAIARWGTRLGSLASKVLRGRNRLAMRNLAATFPSRDTRELRQILSAAWRHFGREALQYLQMQHMSAEEIAVRCPIVNGHIVEESVARGNGTILISAHWGGWEIAGLAAKSVLDRLVAVARPLDNQFLENDLQQLREKTGMEVVDRRRAARALMKGLAENAAIVVLPDQAVQPREGILVPFLGRPAWTTPAPAKMALRSGATIVFGFCIPDGLRHRLEFEEPIRADQLAEDEKDPVKLTTRINDVIARRISERPELWLWMHDRWKGTGEREAMHGV